MNTTASGDSLELRVFDLLQTEISANRFFARPECCKVFRKKPYYSKDREDFITFDLSVEVSLPGSRTCSILILIECKNYSHNVPVDDAEEFVAKVQQVSGVNVKGIMVSTAAFQKGTVAYCRSKGVGVIRYFNKKNFKWVLHRSPSTIHIWSELNSNGQRVQHGLTSSSYQSHEFDFYCNHLQTYTYSLRAFFLDIISATQPDDSLIEQIKNPENPRRLIIDYITRDDLENVVERILNRIDYAGGAVPLHKICEWQSEEVGLKTLRNIVRSSSVLEVEVLGRITFNPLEITVYADPEQNGRERFTLAHELGHHFLGHSKYMEAEYCGAIDLDIRPDKVFSGDDLRRLDWQANNFASCLLLPRQFLTRDLLAMSEACDLRNRGFGTLFVDDQPCNEANYYRITNNLKIRYKVSRSALKLRLEQLGLLYDVTTNPRAALTVNHSLEYRREG
jgi:Zn-dependent peptidase ImmA (M78 family)